MTNTVWIYANTSKQVRAEHAMDVTGKRSNFGPI